MVPYTLATSDYEHFSVQTEEGDVAYEFEGAAAAGRALPGDEVRLVEGGVELAAHSGGMHGRRYATVELVRRAHEKLFLVGTLELNSKSRYGITSRGVLRYKFLPYDASYPPFFVGCSTRDTSRNLLVRVQFDDWPASSTCPIGVLVQTFGPAGDLGSEEEALLTHYAPVRWKGTDPIPCLGTGLEGVATRVDATHLETFHIDPPGCRDIDDAISFQAVGEGEGGYIGRYAVHIHIADVASWIYAYPQMAEKAAEIGQTLYRDGFAVRPMFPAAFSEGHMSLLPGEIRTAWTFVFPWDAGRGVVSLGEGRWERQRIVVKESYTYETAATSRWAGLLERLTSQLVHRPSTDPHEWVEHLMLLYNREAAAMLKRMGTGVLRRHAAPDIKQLERLRGLGLPADRLAMRAGSYCLASEEDTVHWGLGAAVYCHASSPIRRWADCLNQLALAAAVAGEGDAKPSSFQDVAALNAAAGRAKRYERDVAYVRALLGPAAREVHVGTVVEPGRIWVPYLERVIRAYTGDWNPGKAVAVRFFCDAGKRNWKQRLVVELRRKE